MCIQLMTAAAVVLLSAAGATAQPRPESALIGTWKSAPDELRLTTDFDKSVWGANATSIRTVELVVRSLTEATLRVVKRVVNAKRQTVPASTWISRSRKVRAPAASVGLHWSSTGPGWLSRARAQSMPASAASSACAERTWLAEARCSKMSTRLAYNTTSDAATSHTTMRPSVATPCVRPFKADKPQ